MDIGSLSTSLSQASVVDKVGVAVARLAKESDIQDSNGLKKMMELSVNPNVGKNFDANI